MGKKSSKIQIFSHLEIGFLGDVSNLPDGRVAGENQRLPDGDRAYRPQLNQLERDSPRESVHASPAYTMHSDSIGVLRGRTDPRVNVQVSWICSYLIYTINGIK
ncbi:hypothetical protein OESDEN_13064 [Oesophagostomum dentatum]|uniref:Uncharacterized protein n=1 Tax=Oesophagostomum dentatum TaxID=61180 RepID=A0A0B1SUJ8_OESDE|nr:hypothetical protein OESDEN_13064 [Oesophagostomum dentatum]